MRHHASPGESFISFSSYNILRATHLSGESIVVDTMLGTMTIVQSVVDVYLFELIVISEWATRYIDSYLRLFVCSEYQKLPGIV